MAGPDTRDSFRLKDVSLHADLAAAADPNLEHERQVAIFDLIEENYFKPEGSHGGPYFLELKISENRLVFDIRLAGDEQHGVIMLALGPFKRVIKDYFMVCDSYYSAIKTASPSQIEAIDMGRRGLHNEGSELLRERLKGKIDVDFDTARRVFTLICALYRNRI